MGLDPGPWQSATAGQPGAGASLPSPSPTPAPRLVLGGPLVSPWWPAAAVSLALPGVGLLLLADRDRKREAFVILGGYLVGHIVLTVLITLMAGVVPVLPTLLWLVEVLFSLALHVGSMVLTHDETVRAYPVLGRPLVFQRALVLPGLG